MKSPNLSLRIVTGILITSLTSVALSDPDLKPAMTEARLAKAGELVEFLAFDQRYEANQALIEARLQARLEQLEVEEDAPHYDRVQEFKADVQEMMNSTFDYSQDEDAIVEVYASNLTEAELDQLLGFLKSDTYKKFLATQEAFKAELQKMSEARNQEVAENFASIYAEFRNDLLAQSN